MIAHRRHNMSPRFFETVATQARWECVVGGARLRWHLPRRPAQQEPDHHWFWDARHPMRARGCYESNANQLLSSRSFTMRRTFSQWRSRPCPEFFPRIGALRGEPSGAPCPPPSRRNRPSNARDARTGPSSVRVRAWSSVSEQTPISEAPCEPLTATTLEQVGLVRTRDCVGTCDKWRARRFSSLDRF